ncbi:MAG: Crp/Fnr family transcriptional regulator [Halobacteriovoraceae bacterium]|nr:Crp/Fnr family transcriptional regulator [Halobacteriovoraceae bacterium]MCB9093930.1 Crp/Fnr family transcriptional regulator [Halobacteriovoraceae bacterium]
MAQKKDLPQECKDCPSRGKGIFCDLEAAELDEISQFKVVNQFKRGQSIFVEGNPTFGLYCISEGNIKLSKTSEDGKDAIVRIATKGDVLGHRSIFTNTPYNATATALDDSVICFLDKKYILKKIQESPSVAQNIINKLSRDLGASEQRLADMSQKSVKQRLIELLLLLHQSHGIPQDNGSVLIDIKLTREEMASIIGTATETLIRTLSDLKNLDLITLDGKKIIIPDEKKLLEEVTLEY